MLLIIAGNQAQAYAFAQKHNITGYSVVTQKYHLVNYERGSRIVLVGTWAELPNLRELENAARARGMLIQTEAKFVELLTEHRAKKAAQK